MAEKGSKVLVRAEPLREVCSELFRAVDVPQGNAEIIADTLVEADLRGVHSHGCRWMGSYVNRLQKGGVNPRPNMHLIVDTPALVLLDADYGQGQVASVKAMGLAIERAKGLGIGVAGVRNSFHYGAAAYYAMMALGEDMIGFTTTNTTPNTLVWGAAKGRVGNNPIGYAIPAGEEWPVVLDMALSVAAWGKVALAHEEGRMIPFAWVVDESGNPTDDPEVALKGGVAIPIGKYKGSGLGIVMDILSGVLTGANFGLLVPRRAGPSVRYGVGHFFWAMDIEPFMPIDEFKHRMDQMIRNIKSLPLAKDAERIYIPGEIEYENKESYLKEGIPLAASTLERLKELGEELGVEVALG